MLRLANYSLIFSFNVRETFKTNEGVWRETTESSPTPQFSTVMSGAVVAVAQWLVRATDDRVVYDGGRKHCLYKYRFSQ